MAAKFICVLFIFLTLLQGFSCLKLTPRKDGNTSMFTLRKVNVELFYSPVDKKSFDLFIELIKLLKTELGQYMDVMMYPIPNCEMRKSSKIYCKSHSVSGQREALLALEHLCAYNAIVKKPIGGDVKKQTAKLLKSMIKGIIYINCTMEMEVYAYKKIPICRKEAPKERDVIHRCHKTRTVVPPAFSRFDKIGLEHYPFMLLNNMWSEYQDRDMYKHLGHLICEKLFQIPEACKSQIKEDRSDPENLFGIDTSSALSTSTRTFLPYLLAITITILFFR